MKDKITARERLLGMAMLGRVAEESRRRAFDKAVDDAYASRAVCEPIEKAMAEAIHAAMETPDVLANVTLGSASEWVIAARAMRCLMDSDPVMDEKGLAATWEFPNGSAVCVICKTEPARQTSHAPVGRGET